jgi:hypothetical protein
MALLEWHADLGDPPLDTYGAQYEMSLLLRLFKSN